MALVSAQQFPGLVPNVANSLAGGLQAGQQFQLGRQQLQRGTQQLQLGQQQLQAAQAQEQRTAQAREIQRNFMKGLDRSDETLSALATLDPQVFDETFQKAGIIDQFQKNEAANFAFDLERTPFEQRMPKIQARVQSILNRGGDPTATVDLSALGPEDQDSVLKFMQIGALDPQQRLEFQRETEKGKDGLASAKTEILETGATIQALPDKKVEVRNPAGDVVTGQERLDILKEAREAGLLMKEAEAEIAVSRAQRVAAAESRQKRISDLKSEFNTKRRDAARSDVRLSRALTLAEQATQGLTGQLKFQFGKLFPDIDVADEAALSQSLRSLALDELQKFKGPTTDFEFGIAESTVGALGDPRTANIARIKGLKRNNWFINRESEQFNEFVKDGGDPDSFVFNFGEQVKTKKGAFTLEQIQDTAVQNNLTIEEVLDRLNK